MSDFEKEDKNGFESCAQYLSHTGSHRSLYLAISVLLVGVSGMRRLKMTTMDIGQHGYMFSIKSFQRYCQYVNNNGRAMPIRVMVMMTLNRRSTAIFSSICNILQETRQPCTDFRPWDKSNEPIRYGCPIKLTS